MNRSTLIIAAWILLLVVFSTVGSGQATTPTPPSDDAPIKVNTILVNIPLIVSDKDGRYIAGLMKQDFTITIDGEPQEIEYFADAEAPLTVAIIIDISGSTIPFAQGIRDGGRHFIEQLKEADRAMIMTFDQFSEIDVVCPLTADRVKLHKKLDDVNPGKAVYTRRSTRAHGPLGGSMYPDLHDAVYRVLNKEFSGIKGRKAIVVLSDGLVSSPEPEQHFHDLLIESDAMIYPIIILTPYMFGPKKTSVSIDDLSRNEHVIYLNRIAAETGGQLLVATKNVDFKTAFQSIGDQLRKQYVIGFYPTRTGPAKPISIAVSRADASLRAKKIIRMKAPEH